MLTQHGMASLPWLADLHDRVMDDGLTSNGGQEVLSCGCLCGCVQNDAVCWVQNDSK